MNTRRAEEAIIADGQSERGLCGAHFAVEGFSVLDQVARGLMQGHSWLKSKGGSRVLNLN
jgi:hypothetical protein